jgi:isopentenyl-diphosphate delta-isomerase
MHRTVILTDEAGSPIGVSEIIEAHTGEGKLHKAFSVYVFRKDGKEMLIQKRSNQKMLWPLIWANTCCSHPFENEEATTAGERRLREELGFTTPLSAVTDFVYRAEDPSGRGVEHEHVTILRGDIDDAIINPDPAEIAAHQWMDIDELRHAMQQQPAAFAPWFHIGLSKF